VTVTCHASRRFQHMPSYVGGKSRSSPHRRRNAEAPALYRDVEEALAAAPTAHSRQSDEDGPPAADDAADRRTK
jgi:hypothetical protein